MKAKTLIKVAWQSIFKNKMRTFLTMLGIIIGVGAVIMMVAIGEGARQQIQMRINSLGTNMIVITPGSSNQGGVSRGAGTFNRLTVDDALKLERESLYLSAVSPVVFTRTQVIGGQGNWRTTINGVDTDYQVIRDWPTIYGRFFDASEVRAMRKVAVLGKTVADNLFPGEDPVGQQIRIRNVPFQIIGVLAEKGQTAEGNDQDDVILAPYTTVQNRLSGWSRIFQILASTSTPADIPAAQEEMRLIMRESHGLAEWEEDDFTIRNQTDIAQAAQGREHRDERLRRPHRDPRRLRRLGDPRAHDGLEYGHLARYDDARDRLLRRRGHLLRLLSRPQGREPQPHRSAPVRVAFERSTF